MIADIKSACKKMCQDVLRIEAFCFPELLETPTAANFYVLVDWFAWVFLRIVFSSE